MRSQLRATFRGHELHVDYNWLAMRIHLAVDGEIVQTFPAMPWPHETLPVLEATVDGERVAVFNDPDNKRVLTLIAGDAVIASAD